MVASDAVDVLRIYQEGIDTGHATFQSSAGDWQQWDQRHLQQCRLVVEDPAAGVLGWFALSAVTSRCVYRGVAEVALYVAPAARGRGLGRVLLAEAVRHSEEAGIWTLQAGIFPENTASLRCHEACGFRRVGVHERLARMGFGPLAGRWRDVLLLERRSERVGID